MADRIVYTKFSNDRARQYCIKTDIIKRDENKVVRKEALIPESRSHILAMLQTEQKLGDMLSRSKMVPNHIVGSGEDYVEFEYIQGQAYDEILDDYVLCGDKEGFLKAVSEFFECLDQISETEFEISETFEKCFGKTSIETKEKSLSFCDIDLIFQNVLVDDAGIWHVIDYEWTVDCAVPVDFIKYRALMLYMNGLSKRDSVKGWDLYSYFGMDEKHMRMYEEMEQHFQSYIKQGHVQIGEAYHQFGQPAIITSRLIEKKENQLITVYYDYGEGFSENAVCRYSSFPISISLDADVKQLRIDPINTACLVENICIRNSKGAEVSYWCDATQINNAFMFSTDDPYIVIKDFASEADSISVDMKVVPLNSVAQNIIEERIAYEEKYEEAVKDHTNALGVIAYNKQEIARLNQVIESMKHSLSWRITSPFRSIVDKTYCFIHRHKTTAVLYDGTRYLMHNGIRSTYRRTKELYGRNRSVMSSEDFKLTPEQIKEQQNTRFSYEPVISILVPLYNTPELFLREMIESVTTQTYGNWQLCLADGSDEEHSEVAKICKEYYKKDKSIVYQHLEKNGGISDNTNACIELATGDFIGLFDHDDLLTQDVLFEVVKRINTDADIDALYTDEDKMLYNDKDGSCKYVEPHCKSDFNLDLFRTNNYICHFFVVRKSIVDEVGGFRKEYDGSQDFDFIFRCVEKARKVEHIAKILYHWRIHANSTAANPQSKMYCYEAGKHAIESHLERQGVTAEVEMTEHLGFYRVKYPVKGKPLISIIIPNKDEKNTLKTCIDSILTKSTYDNYEIIIVENNSNMDEIFEYYKELEKNPKIHIETWEDSFNYSKINNFGVEKSHGDYILLLNNDVEVISPNWLEELLSNCQRDEVGITGAKLIYPDDTVQHCGVIIGLGGIAGHAFVGLDRNHPGYFGRAFIQQDLSAVTAACLMVSREIFEEVGGLEETLQVAFNDVDFCLKVRRAGYLVVMDPNAQLYHYESKSRGAEDTPEKQARFASEVQYMAEHWTDILKTGDPYYNPNLTLIRGDFSMKGKDEVAPRYV